MGARVNNAKSLYLTGIRDGKPADAISRYAGERYTQHSTVVKDGKEGFVEFFTDWTSRNPDRDIEIVRAFEDGRYVFLHVTQSLDGGASRWVTADIFDTDDQARMIEHWDIISEWVDETASGHTQFDGPTEPTDLDKTAQNKALVGAFIENVLTKGQADRITDYISTETYIQHNPLIADGLDGLGAFLTSLAGDGKSMAYKETYLLIGSGDFVAALSRLDFAGTEMAAIDLFRVSGGKIVEHWDVMEPVPAEDELVNSGKF
jgi:predicted SnoaL-like aldol condensation-catalyzing enzyme